MRRSDKYARQQLTRTLLGVVIIAALLGFGIFVLFKKQQINAAVSQLDKGSFCPLRDIPSITAIVVDSTDALTIIQKASLKNELEALVESIPRFGRLELYGVESSRDGPLKPLFSLCSPGRKEEISQWTGNPERIAKMWKEKFQAPSLEAISALLESAKKDESPLLETIQSISITSLQGRGLSERAQRRLVVASDMIEFSSDLNMYKGIPNSQEFLRSEAFRKLKGDLRGVEVSILLFRRVTAAQIQNETFIQFWAALLAKQGAVDVLTKPVIG